MDPSIMKLLEEDEDETMHSGADVEAFQAALNRDIGGDVPTALHPHQSDGPSQGDATHLSSQSYTGWQSANRMESADSQIQLEENNFGHRGQSLSHDPPQNQPEDGPEQINRAQEDLVQMSQATTLQASQTSSGPSEPATTTTDRESQYLKLQKMSNQQASAPEQAGDRLNRAKQVPFALLLPVILPQLDKDRAEQLQTLYAKLKNNDIPKDGFIRIMRGIVGDQMLKMAVMKIHTQPSSRQMHMQASGSIRPSQSQMRPAGNATSHITISSSLVRPNTERNAQNSQIQIPVTPYQYGNSYRPFSGTKVPNPGSSINNRPHDLPLKQFPQRPSIGSSHIGMTTQSMTTMPKLEAQNSIHNHGRTQSGSAPSFVNNTPSLQNSIPWRPTSKEQGPGSFSSLGYVKHEPSDHPCGPQQKTPVTNVHGLPSVLTGQLDRIPVPLASKDNSVEQLSLGTGFSAKTTGGNLRPEALSTTVQSANSQLTPSLPVNNAKTPSKNPAVGQKKPLETLGSSPLSASKKQKLSGGAADQSIEQLIDVTAVSGVNLREEEEHLFSGSKEDSRVSEASRKVVQEEEESLILQRGPLQKKMAEIMSKCGLKNISNDVEKCLSLCVEERLRGLLYNLIRVSKQPRDYRNLQRVDLEKTRHRTVITSDIRQQLMTINRKAREEWDKKHAEVEKLRKLNEPEGNQSVEAEKDKDEGRGKSMKNPPANKEEDDKMRTTAANVAARAAVGGDDMLSKWQLMAEQARQKREGNSDAASGSQSGKDSKSSITIPGKSETENRQGNKRGQVSGAPRKIVRNPVVVPQPKVVRTITVKDVIAVLEREPQMSKSTLVYRLYDKVRCERRVE